MHRDGSSGTFPAKRIPLRLPRRPHGRNRGPDSGQGGILNQQIALCRRNSFVEAERVVRTSGVQLPLWPLELEILIAHRHFPTFTSPNDLINFLTNLVEAGVISDRKAHTQEL
jgi:hypothetical protein